MKFQTLMVKGLIPYLQINPTKTRSSYRGAGMLHIILN